MKIEMVVFDWAGTTTDYGSQAPTHVFKRSFEKKGIFLSNEQINKPMGMEKKGHIRTILSFPEVLEMWKKKYGHSPTEDDVNEIFEIFENDLISVVEQYAIPIDKVVESVNKLRNTGIKIGSTTGYASNIMERVVPKAKSLGYYADCVVTPDLVDGLARPTPFMIFECMKKLNVCSVAGVLKVGDTIMDILEGKNAGVKTVGLLTGSNLMGLSKEEYDAISDKELNNKKNETKQKYLEAGADYVIDNMSEIFSVIKDIEEE